MAQSLPMIALAMIAIIGMARHEGMTRSAQTVMLEMFFQVPGDAWFKTVQLKAVKECTLLAGKCTHHGVLAPLLQVCHHKPDL